MTQVTQFLRSFPDARHTAQFELSTFYGGEYGEDLALWWMARLAFQEHEVSGVDSTPDGAIREALAAARQKVAQ